MTRQSVPPSMPFAPVQPAGTRRRQARVLDPRGVDSALLETVRESVMADAGPVTASRVAAAVQATGRLLGTAGSLAAVERISAELNGLGPLQVLTRDVPKAIEELEELTSAPVRAAARLRRS